MNSALKQEISVFANRNTPKNMQFLDKIHTVFTAALRSVDKEKATGPLFLTHPSIHYPRLTARHFFSHEQVASSTASFYSSHRCTVIVTTIGCVTTVMVAHRSKTTITLSSASDFMFPQRDQRFLASQSHTSHRMILLYRRLITLLLLHLIRVVGHSAPDNDRLASSCPLRRTTAEARDVCCPIFHQGCGCKGQSQVNWRAASSNMEPRRCDSVST